MVDANDSRDRSLSRGGTERRRAEETTGDHSGALSGDENSAKLEIEGLHGFEETTGELSADAEFLDHLPERRSGGTARDSGPLSDDPLKQYLYDLRQFTDLEREEELALAERFQSGDREAGFRLINSHLRLVVKIAMVYRKVYPNVLDLIQEGNLGLIQAVKRFEPARGARLGTYAGWWIRAYVIKFITDNSRMVRIGTTNARRKVMMSLARQKRALEAKGITPTAKLLADEMGVDEKDVLDVERAMGRDVSLDAPVRGLDDSGAIYLDTIKCVEQSIDDRIAQGEFQLLLRQKFEEFSVTLAEREQLILRHHLVAEDPIPLQEIADRFGMSRDAIRVAEKRLIAKLRKYMAGLVKDLRRMDSGK
jgi:RNA polymerase sigma-32 factor